MKGISENIFNNCIKKTYQKSYVNFILLIYEIIPLIFLSSYSILNSQTATNYLSYFLKYFSSHYHLELLNFYFKNSCPWANLENTNNHKILGKKSFLENLSLDIKYCKLNETLYFLIFILFVLIIPITYIIFTRNFFSHHLNKTTNRLLTFCVNLNFLIFRPMALWFFLIFMQSIIYYYYGSVFDTSVAFYSTDYISFYVSVLCLVCFIYLSHIYIKTIRFHEGIDSFNYKTKTFDYFMLFSKILFSFQISLRKMIFNDFADKLLIFFQLLILSLFIYQSFIEQTVSNFKIVYFKKCLIMFCSMIIVVNYLNFYFEIFLISCLLFEYIIIFLVCIVYYFIPESYIDYSFISNTGQFIYEKSFQAFVLESLKYICIYKEKLEKLKNKISSEDTENEIIKENLNLLNLHYWNCNIVLLDLKCPLCEVHRSGIINNISNSYLTDILLNEHLILKGLFKFIHLIDKKILVSIENSNFIIKVGVKEIQPLEIGSKIDQVDLFYLKYSLLKITENRLNRIIFNCSLTQNNFRNNFYLQLYTNFLKLQIKKHNKDLFEEFEKIRLHEELSTQYNKALDITNDLIQDLELKEFNYTLLLKKYTILGNLNLKIKKGLKMAQKNKKFANRVDLIIKNSVYNFIFNSYIETYPDCLIDLVDHTKYLELRFMKDNILTIDFSLLSKELIVSKVPTDENLNNFFSRNDLNKNFENFFPREIRKSEKSKFIENILQNKTNYFNFDTFLLNKENFIFRMNLKIKIFLTIENSFKIYVSINPYEENNFFILLKNGKLCSVSEKFYKIFSIHPFILTKKLNLSIFQLIYEMNDFKLQKKEYDLSDHEEFQLEIDFNLYMNNLEKILNSIEDEQINSFKKIPGTQTNLISDQIYLSSSKSSHKLFNFKQIEKIASDIESGEVLIYTFFKNKKTQAMNNQGNSLDSKLIYQSHFDENEEKRNEEFSNYREEMEIDNNKSISDNSKSSTQSFMKKKDEKNNYYFLSGLNQNLNKYHNNFKKMRSFCHYIIIINFTIFLVGLTFLFIVNFQLKEIDSNFQIFHTFMNESWNLYSSYLSLMSFVTIKDISKSDEGNEENSDFLISQYVYKNTSFHFDFAKYFRSNLASKSDNLDESIKITFQYADANFFNQLINFDSEYFYFSNANDKYSLDLKDMSNLLEIYQNLIHTIIYDSEIFYRINIINMSNNEYFIQNISNYFRSDLTRIQIEKKIMTIIINYYKNLHYNFNKIFSKLEKNLTGLVNLLSYTNFIGLSIAFLFTVIIFFMTYMLIRVYQSQVKIVMNVILSLSNENLQQMKKKLKLVRKLLNGVSNPYNIVEKLKINIAKLKSQYNMHNITTPSLTLKKSNICLDSNVEQNQETSNKNEGIIRDEFYITNNFLFILFIMILILSIYFTIAFMIFYYNSKIMHQRIDLNSAFLKNLKFPIDQFVQLKTTLFLNKTNLNENYFDQKISLEDYFNDVKDFNFRENLIKQIIKNTDEDFMNDFFNKMSQNNVCRFLLDLHSQSYQENKDFSLNDFLSGFEIICSEFSILKTDYFSIMEMLNRNIRDALFSYYYSDKTIHNIKNLLDSKKMCEINLIQSFIINPLFSYILDKVLSPGFQLDFSTVLLDCIVVLIFNIITTVGFYFVINRMILSKAIQNGNNLNTIINIIN
jgi:hypothetical protein